MELTSTQREAIHHIDGHLQIIACAGSGKTEVISRRIANILQKKAEIKPENMVAFTFTEKAAASLKTRIEKALGSQVTGMYIGTIHGFCNQLLRKHTEDFSKFKVLDTVQNHLFIDRYIRVCGMETLGLSPSLQGNHLFLQCIDKLIDNYDHRESWPEIQATALQQYGRQKILFQNCL